METLLDVRDLQFSYGDRLAVTGVSFTVARGEIFGLLGPNGAGKTTTIAMLVGLLAPQAGEMRFAGGPFRPARRAPDRARIGFVPQELALYDELTAAENLAFFAGILGIARGLVDAEVSRALSLAGLDDRGGDAVGTFSGGMKRRLNLAIGTLGDPDLVVLDEPTVGVDPQSRSHVFDALERLRDDGRALLYTTHYMEEAERLCSRVAILDRGRMLDCGTPVELADRAGAAGASLEAVFLRHTGRSLRDS
jgi:ABC-2 type transport system ATP-binding protein